MAFDTSHALCTRCGTEFPRTELSPLEDALLCSECRPLHLEHLRRYRADKSGRKFLYSATAPDGGKVTDYVEAANLAAARYALDLRGYRNIVFHEDDISTATNQLWDSPADKPQLDGDVHLKMLQNNSALYNFWLFLKQSPILNLLMLALIVARIYQGQPLHWSAILAYGYFALITAFYLFASLPLMRYNRLNKAVEWGRWDEVQQMVDRIRKSNRHSLAKVPEFELDVRSAQVLAARGKLDEGLALLMKYEEDPKVEPFLYHGRRSEVYRAAQDYENYLAETVKASELAPTSGSMQVDVALAYALRIRDAEAAQRHLDRAKEMTLPALATGWLHMIQGMILLEQGKLAEADTELENAQTFFEEKHYIPFAESLVYIIKTHRAMAAAAVGKLDGARLFFAEARTWLESTDEMDLLQRVKAALEHNSP